MKKLRLTILLFSTLAILSACKFNLISELYLSDLREVALNENTELTTPATLEIEIPSEEKCQEYSTKLTNLMEGLISGISPKGCEDRGYDTYLLIDVQIPIVNGFDAWHEIDLLFGILLSVSDEETSVYMMNNLEKYEILTKRIYDEFYQTLDISKSKITIVLNNIQQQDEVILTRGVFLDNTPVDNFREFVLKRRDRIDITLSNVGSAHLESDGSALAFVLKHDLSRWIYQIQLLSKFRKILALDLLAEFHLCSSRLALQLG